MSTPVVTSRASHRPAEGDPRFDVQLIVRVTPELAELIKEGAEAEDRRVAEFVRESVIFRLGALGLVPVVAEADDEPS